MRQHNAPEEALTFEDVVIVGRPFAADSVFAGRLILSMEGWREAVSLICVKAAGSKVDGI